MRLKTVNISKEKMQMLLIRKPDYTEVSEKKIKIKFIDLRCHVAKNNDIHESIMLHEDRNMLLLQNCILHN